MLQCWRDSCQWSQQRENASLPYPDVECLNKSLKLRQFIRANRSKHPIRMIQRYCMEKLGYSSVIQQEYDKITEIEEVMRVAQELLTIYVTLAGKQ